MVVGYITDKTILQTETGPWDSIVLFQLHLLNMQTTMKKLITELFSITIHDEKKTYFKAIEIFLL